MENVIYLAVASVVCLGFAGMNFVLNEGGILPGWILLGVVFAVVGAATVVFGDDTANGGVEA